MTAAVVAGYSLAFPDRWFPLPAGDASDWAGPLASDILSGTAAAQDEASLASLGRELRQVEESARGVALPAQTAAVLARTPGETSLDAMVVVGIHPEGTRGAFEQRIAELRDGVIGGGEIMSFTQIESEAPAGAVVGCHTLVGYLDADAGSGVAHLEERVVLGVCPDVVRGVVEVTAISSSLTSFDDMAQEILDLLGGLTVQTEPL